MTPLWSPCRRVWEALSHYLFNAPARAAQPQPGGVKLHFKPRCSAPGQFGEEQVMKVALPKRNTSLHLVLSSTAIFSLLWISRRWAAWTPTMRTAQKSLSRCSTVTPLPRWRRRSWMPCTRTCRTHSDHEPQTWTWVSKRKLCWFFFNQRCCIS